MADSSECHSERRAFARSRRIRSFLLEVHSRFWLSPFLIRHGLRRATFPPGEGMRLRAEGRGVREAAPYGEGKAFPWRGSRLIHSAFGSLEEVGNAVAEGLGFGGVFCSVVVDPVGGGGLGFF